MQVGFAQKKKVNNPWTIKTSYFRTPIIDFEEIEMNNFDLEADYRLFKAIDVGIYSGFGWFKLGFDKYSRKYYHQIHLGANANLHILPLFVKSDELKIDFYLVGKLGVIYTDNSYYLPENNYNLAWATYFGTAYYFGRHFGIFVELGKAEFVQLAFNIKYGLSFKF